MDQWIDYPCTVPSLAQAYLVDVADGAEGALARATRRGQGPGELL